MFDKLKGLVPQTLIDDMVSHEINTPLRAAHFLAQAAHESGGFKFKSENLNYSKESLLKVFPKYFTAASAEGYHRQPEKIASRVYANRMGNGDEASKDGYAHSCVHGPHGVLSHVPELHRVHENDVLSINQADAQV